MQVTYKELLDEELLDVELASRSLREYINIAWHQPEPVTELIPNWHIDAICEHLEAVTAGEIRRLIINIPPGFMKSLSVCVFWPTWMWIDQPWLRMMFASYAESLSMRDSLKCRRLIQSDWYQARWGDRFSLTSDQNVKAYFDNDKSGFRLATSVEGKATGQRAGICIIDDPHKTDEYLSDVKRQRVADWYDNVWAFRKTDPKTAAEVLVMQRLHDSDLTGHVIKHGGWEVLKLPLEYVPTTYISGIGWEDPRIVEGALLFPELFGENERDEAKVKGSFVYAGQFQQDPVPSEGGAAKRKWWKFYIVAPAVYDDSLQSWDMAFKDLDTSSYVVGEVWIRVGAQFYLLDQVREHMDFIETCAAMEALTTKWPDVYMKLVEDKANGPAVIVSLQKKIPGIIAEPVHGSKEARAAAVSPLIEAGNVLLPDPDGTPWVNEFIEEWARFPKGQHDDQVDATSQALLRFMQYEPLRSW